MPVSFTTKTLKFSAVLLYLFPIIVFAGPTAQSDQDYRQYHMEINEAEKFVSTENFEEAFHLYEQVFNTYDFVFLRDYKIAAQISFYIDNREKTFEYITKGISAGWELKELKKHNYLDPLRDDPGWEVIEDAYPDLRRTYESGIDEGVREQVHQMFKRDQWKALGAMLRIGAKAKERFYLNKFAPHSEIQMARLIEILERQGYPGEKLIGNDFWMSTIISHHNSISQEYVEMDTLYSYIEPVLIQAIENGQMSPYEYALVDDWRIAVSSDRTETGYGFLNPPNQSTLSETNQMRQHIGLRTVELRNSLIDVENKTGLNFYLPDWIDGKIIIDHN